MLSDAEVCYSDNPSEVEGQNVSFSPDSELSEEAVGHRVPPKTAFISTSTTPLIINNEEDDEEDDVYDESRDEDDEEEEEEEEDDDEDGETPSANRQKKIMKLLELNQPPLKVGDFWYLIDIQWFRRWKQFVKYDWGSGGAVSRPGPITNEGLLESETDRVSRSLIEHSHYAIISKSEWEHLVSWYGGGPEIARPVISTGPYNKSVEVRKLNLIFIKSSEPEETVRHEFSKTTTVKKMKEEMCEILELEQDNVRIWDYHNKHRSQLLENLDKTLSECTIIHNQYILFEEKLENGEWAPAPARATTSYSSGYSSSYSSGYSWGNSYSYQNRGKEPTDPGLCGLSNLGNTCFMNSSLQSLSNCPILTSFFLSDEYKTDINRDNPIGTGGKLVEQYATLLRDMWSGEYKFIAPREFKHKLETFAPQFQGMQQHDSQELLGFLLDGLHEDLNRVKNKPYIELKEAEGREDSIVAAEAWQNHLARNDSKIVDLYHGQLKSKLTCPDCDRVSVTFDPCMYLSLPLPMETTRVMKVKIVLQDPREIPMERQVTVPKDGVISDLKNAVSELVNIPTDNLAVVELWNHKIYKVYNNTETMERMQEKDDIRVCYVDSPEVRATTEDDEEEETPARPVTSYYSYNNSYYKPKVVEHPDDIIHVQVILRKKEHVTTSYYYRTNESFAVFGTPVIISCRRGIVYEELHDLVAQKLVRFFDDPSVLEFPDDSSGMEVDESHDTENDTMHETAGESSIDAMEPENVAPTTDAGEKQSAMDTVEKESSMDTAVEGDDGDEPAAEENAQEPVGDDIQAEGESPTPETVGDNGGQTSGDDGGELNSADDTVSDEPEYGQEPSEPETSEAFPNFFLHIVDSSGQRKIRDLEFRQQVNFSSREVLSVTFTEELVPLYNSAEDARIDKELVDEKTVEEDKDDSIDIAECFDLFTVEEQLGPDDPWYCNKCKDQKQATKKFDFWKFPPLLVIHLKRFSYRNRYRRDKIDTLVNFPLTDLDLSRHMLNPEPQFPPIYDLMAVSNHFGALGGGHYTAFAKNYNDNKWYKFDDSNVSPVNESKICSSAAYVLFYRRKDVQIPVEQLKYEPTLGSSNTKDEDEDEDEDEAEDEITDNDIDADVDTLDDDNSEKDKVESNEDNAQPMECDDLQSSTVYEDEGEYESESGEDAQSN